MKRFYLFFLIICFSFSILHASNIKQDIQSKFNSLSISNESKVFLFSMLPIFELRGAIPIGIIEYQMNPLKVFIISVLGNMVPIFFILIFFGYIEKLLRKKSLTSKFLDKIFARTRSKSEVMVKYEELGLMLFVAIPLPVTGAWTGSLAAYLFGFNFWISILYIFLGVSIAGVIVTSLSILGWWGLFLAITILLLIIINNLIKGNKKNANKKMV